MLIHWFRSSSENQMFHSDAFLVVLCKKKNNYFVWLFEGYESVLCVSFHQQQEITKQLLITSAIITFYKLFVQLFL